MSAEVCDTLATFGAALDCVREKLQTAAIENEMATLRAELYGSFTATIEEKHQRVLARKLINERRKEEAERVSTEEQLEKRRAKAMTQRNVLVTRGCSPHGAGGAQGVGAPREGAARCQEEGPGGGARPTTARGGGGGGATDQEAEEAARKKKEEEQERLRVLERQKQNREAPERHAAQAAARDKVRKERGQRSRGADEDEDELPTPPSPTAGREDESKREEEAKKEGDERRREEEVRQRPREPNEENWQEHRMGGGRGGDDRFGGGKGGGGPARWRYTEAGGGRSRRGRLRGRRRPRRRPRRRFVAMLFTIVRNGIR